MSKLVASTLAFLWTFPALAYIDPGVSSRLEQGIYALVFGAILVFVFRPWKLLKSRSGAPKKGRIKEADTGK